MVWWYIAISWNVAWENWIAVFRSRSWWKFKLPMNVCLADVFWTSEPFVAKIGIVMHHHELECRAKRMVGYFQCKGYSKGSFDQNMTVSTIYIFWTGDSFATKLGLIVHYHKPDSFMEKLDCCVQGKGHSKILKCQWMFVRIIFSQSLHHYEPDCLSTRLVCCLQGPGHS